MVNINNKKNIFKKNKFKNMAASVFTPTKLSLIFLSFFWLLLRYLYVSGNANNNINELVHFTAILFLVIIIIYSLLIMAKLGLFLADDKKNLNIYVPWIIFIIFVILSVMSFKGYILAGKSISFLAANNQHDALTTFSILLNKYKLIPAMPIVTGIFATTIKWTMMPKIDAINIIVLTSGCVGLTVFGFYSYYWKILPKHLSIGNIVFGALGSVFLIGYIANFQIISTTGNGKLIVRLAITIIFTIAILALYMDYWSKSKKKIMSKEIDIKDEKKIKVENNKEGVLGNIASKDKENIDLPPSTFEVGMWLFFGLVVFGDVVNNV